MRLHLINLQCPAGTSQIFLAYKLDVNEYRGQRTSTTDCGEDRINTQNDNIEEEWDEGPSKSEIKREMLALQKLGERLTSLFPSYLARMTLK